MLICITVASKVGARRIEAGLRRQIGHLSAKQWVGVREALSLCCFMAKEADHRAEAYCCRTSGFHSSPKAVEKQFK
jgi:hypothetical protein